MFITIGFLASACAAQNTVGIAATYPEMATAQILYAQASTVIIGTVSQSKAQQIDIADHTPTDDPQLNPGGDSNPVYAPYTIHQVKITRVVKGNVKVGDTISVGELGGVIGNTNYKTDEGILMQDGKTYLLFLQNFANAPYGLLNPVESVYQVSGSRALQKDARNHLNTSDVQQVTNM